MNLLLDTHIIVWALGETRRLSERAKALLTNDDHTFWYSPITAVEIAIKNSLGKLPLNRPLGGRMPPKALLPLQTFAEFDRVLDAYVRAALMTSLLDRGCGMSWWALASSASS